MANKIKVDIISDIVCPWCVIGYKRLAQAISETGLEQMVEIEWHPFELNPGMSKDGEEIISHLARKYDSTEEESIRTLAMLVTRGAELGFHFDYFDGFKMINTGDLHLLLDYAKESGKQTELKMRLFEAFFSERKDLSDRHILAGEVTRVGLDVTEALLRLDDDRVRSHVQTQKEYWQRQGISAVPTVIFNHSYTDRGSTGRYL